MSQAHTFRGGLEGDFCCHFTAQVFQMAAHKVPTFSQESGARQGSFSCHLDNPLASQNPSFFLNSKHFAGFKL